jgi:tetratricopeptide (TPR) repeat protein
MFYNDQPPDMIFYQGLARQKLGQIGEAREVFERLVAYGRSHLHDEVKMDYFAVSLPDFLVFDDDLTQRNQIHCHYMMGLGYLGLGEMEKAREHFTAVLALDANHAGTAVHQKLIKD